MKTTIKSAALAAAMLNRPRGLVGTPRADAGATAAQLAEIKALTATLREDVMKTAEAAVKKAESGEALSAELKATIDKLLPKFNEASASVAKLEGQLEALETSNRDLAQAVAMGGKGAQARKSVGQQIAASDQIKAYVAAGFTGTCQVNAAITTADSNNGGGLIWDARDEEVVSMARRTLRIRDLLTVSPVNADLVKYRRQTVRTQNGGMTAEGAAPTKSVFGWSQAEAAVRKIVAMTDATDEALADAAQLATLVDGELRYELDLKEEQQVLAGDNTGQNLHGLIPNATAFSAAAGLPNTNRIERLRLAMLQVVLADYAADGIVLNPTDWAAIELTKDTTGRFIVGNADSPIGPSIWRLPVVESNTISAGTWLVGAMRIAATLYDRMSVEVLISSENATNFEEGLKTMKATRRLALAVKRPTSLVSGNFTFA